MIDDTFHQDICMVSDLKGQIQVGREERLRRKAIEKKKQAKADRVNPVKIYKQSKELQEKRKKRRAKKNPLVTDEDFNTILGHAQEDGFWSVHSRIDLLKHLHTDLEFAINKAEESIGVSAHFSQFILTMVALDLLNTFFPNRKDEWKDQR